MLRRTILAVALFALLSLSTNLMAQPFPVAQQVYPVGVTIIPGTFTRPANAVFISAQIANPTDWQSGAAGRTLTVDVHRSLDGGQTWGPAGGGSDTTPHMGHGGAFPTIVLMDLSGEPANTIYRVAITVAGGSISTAWLITVQ